MGQGAGEGAGVAVEVARGGATITDWGVITGRGGVTGVGMTEVGTGNGAHAARMTEQGWILNDALLSTEICSLFLITYIRFFRS